MASNANNQPATASSTRAVSSASPSRSTAAKTSPGVIKLSAPKTPKRKKDREVWKNGVYKTLAFLQSLPNKLLVFIVSLWARLTSGSEKHEKSVGPVSKTSVKYNGSRKGASKVGRTSGRKKSVGSAADDQSVVSGVDGGENFLSYEQSSSTNCYIANKKRKKNKKQKKDGKENEAAATPDIEVTAKLGDVQHDTRIQPDRSTTLSKNKSSSNLADVEPPEVFDNDAWEIYESKATKKRTKKETRDTSSPKPTISPNYRSYAGEQMDYLPSSESDATSDDGGDDRSETPSDSEEGMENGSKGESGDISDNDAHSGDSNGSEDSDHPEEDIVQENEDIDGYDEYGEDGSYWSEGSIYTEKTADPKFGGIDEADRNGMDSSDRPESSRHSEKTYIPKLGVIDEIDEDGEDSGDYSGESNHSEEDTKQGNEDLDLDEDGGDDEETGDLSQGLIDFEDGRCDGTEEASDEEVGEAQENGGVKEAENGSKLLNDPEESGAIVEAKSKKVHLIEEIEPIPPTSPGPSTDDQQCTDTAVTAEPPATEAKFDWADSDYEDQFPSLQELSNFAKKGRAKK